MVDDVPGEFAARVVQAFLARSRDSFSIALTGGRTARACYERLAADAGARINWWCVQVYWADERCVPADHPDSNQRLGRTALLERVGAADALHPMSCDDGPDPYQLALGELGQIDLVHLVMGEDGHVASLFPQSPALDADAGRLVALNWDPLGHHPHQRLTLTLSGLARARLVVFTVCGAAKRDILRAVRDGADLPATRVQADQVIWLVDPAAAGSLLPGAG